MSPLILAVVLGIGALVLIFFIWYQIQRGKQSFSKVDHSKLKDWDEDGWDDDWGSKSNKPPRDR